MLRICQGNFVLQRCHPNNYAKAVPENLGDGTVNSDSENVVEPSGDQESEKHRLELFGKQTWPEGGGGKRT